MSLLTDAGLGLKIKVAMIADDSIEAQKIHVKVSEGVAELEGHVRYPALGTLVEGIALRCGARGVVNHLEVDEPEHHPVSAIVPEDAPQVTTPAGATPVEPAPAIYI